NFWTPKLSNTVSTSGATCATSTESLPASLPGNPGKKSPLRKPRSGSLETCFPKKEACRPRLERHAFFTSSESDLRPIQLRRRKTSLHEDLLDALDVTRFRGVHANLITFVDKRGNRNYQA